MSKEYPSRKRKSTAVAAKTPLRDELTDLTNKPVSARRKSTKKPLVPEVQENEDEPPKMTSKLVSTQRKSTKRVERPALQINEKDMEDEKASKKLTNVRRKSTKKIQPGIQDDVIEDESTACCSGGYTTCAIVTRKMLKKRLLATDSSFMLDGHLVDQLSELSEMLRQCVLHGESNSAILIGPQGSGKTKLINAAISSLDKESDGTYFCVNLSGIVHTDDKSALQEMARQLELENVIGDRVFGSFAENFTFILESLKRDSESSKSVIVVIEEFDLFTAHKNQSLLYNLFDIAQSRQTPICILGCTRRLDVVELLEKRVKSRYSHRVVLTFPDYTLAQYRLHLRQLLSLPESFNCKTFRRRWENRLHTLLEKKDAKNTIERIFSTRKDIGTAAEFFLLPLCNLSAEHPFLALEDLKESVAHFMHDSKAAILKGLSVLELCLIVATTHVMARREGQPFNFEIIYNEYKRFLEKGPTGIPTFEKAVALKAYEHLIAIEIITEGVAQANLMKEYKLMRLLLDSTQVQEALSEADECPTELKNWAQSMFA